MLLLLITTATSTLVYNDIVLITAVNIFIIQSHLVSGGKNHCFVYVKRYQSIYEN
jgi:hypothetical protein